MYLEQFFIDGFGCASYLIGCEKEGVAAVVDPDRDVQKYQDAAVSHGLKITHIIETHLHADHISGNTGLARYTRAEIYIHEAARAAFPHRVLKDGDRITLGTVRLDVRHTPGHTPESVTLLVSDTTRSEQPWLALTGDLLFVGEVGRPDLVSGSNPAGETSTDEQATAESEMSRKLAGDLYNSLFGSLLKLDDGLQIFPGHGAGSLCGRSLSNVRSSTLGYERRNSPALALTDRNSFIEHASGNLPEPPANHQMIKEINRRGPVAMENYAPQPLTIQDAIPQFQMGAALLDLRSDEAYARIHIPGSAHIPASDLAAGGSSLSNKVGFLLDPSNMIILLLEDPAHCRAAVMALARVGYERVIGYLAESLEAWKDLGLPVASGNIKDINAMQMNALLNDQDGNGLQIIDVREPWEYQQGHIPDAALIPLKEMGNRLDEIDCQQPVALVCASGSRSRTAATLLAQKGCEQVYNLRGGMYGWSSAGLPVKQGD